MNSNVMIPMMATVTLANCGDCIVEEGRRRVSGYETGDLESYLEVRQDRCKPAPYMVIGNWLFLTD
jgi:hypothetical protein